MTIRIGKARYEEANSIVDFLISARSDTDGHEEEPDLPHAYIEMLRMIESGVVFVARKEKSIVGVIAATPYKQWQKKAPHYLQTDVFFVHPNYRKGGIAVALVNKAKKAADALGVALVVSISTGKHPELKDRFVQGQGFVYMGGNLIYHPAVKYPD